MTGEECDGLSQQCDQIRPIAPKMLFAQCSSRHDDCVHRVGVPFAVDLHKSSSTLAPNRIQGGQQHRGLRPTISMSRHVVAASVQSPEQILVIHGHLYCPSAAAMSSTVLSSPFATWSITARICAESTSGPNSRSATA